MAARKSKTSTFSADKQRIIELLTPLGKKYVDALPEFETREEFYEWVLAGIASCHNCLLASTRSTVTAPDGVLGAEIMIIAEGPGYLEDRTGLPMVGPLELVSSRCSTCVGSKKCFGHRMLENVYKWKKKPTSIPKCVPNLGGVQTILPGSVVRSAGSILDGILIKKWKYAYPRHNWIEQYNSVRQEKWTHKSPFYLTNIVMCRSFDTRTDKDTPPPSTAKNQCRKWLLYQYAAVQPKIIVALGKVALGALLGSEKATAKIRNNTILQTKFGPVIFQVHPASIMREPNKFAKGYGYAKVAETLELALNYCGKQV